MLFIIIIITFWKFVTSGRGWISIIELEQWNTQQHHAE